MWKYRDVIVKFVGGFLVGFFLKGISSAYSRKYPDSPLASLLNLTVNAFALFAVLFLIYISSTFLWQRIHRFRR